MGKFTDVSRKLTDAINTHKAEAVGNLYAADAVAYDPMYPEPLRGRDAIKRDYTGYLRGFPDIRFEILTIVEKDDRSGAGEMRFTGTQTGPLETPTGGEVPPTNKRVDIKGAVFAKVNDSGEIVEERRYYDVASMLRQLGLTPQEAPEEMGARS
jgi:steroid delta-isomerase-like uncharacterized protein